MRSLSTLVNGSTTQCMKFGCWTSLRLVIPRRVDSAPKRHQHSQRHSKKAIKHPTSIGPQSKHSEELRALQRVDELLQDALKLLESSTVPDEATVLDSLRTCESLAKYFSASTDSPGAAEEARVTPAMNLLFLDEKDTHKSSQSAAILAAAIKSQAVERLSSTAYKVVASPKVFITPKILETYVHVQSSLGKPETLSQIFSLYANKPMPKPGSSPIQYTAASPNSLASAIPTKIATEALTAAIEAKNLDLCLDIINSSVCTPAFRRTKIFKRALVPLLGLSLAPLAAYTLASQISVYQDSMSPEMATNIAFAGILAYVSLTATVGIVAVTTANDQMDRVTWATGTRLRDRWLREEERAMIDRVAGAWGFKETWRRGEEEGPDWAALKEVTGLRGMVLDRVELMEGME
ncbi:hypothetical protein MMC13_004381 [Lambiella insularis]|nr:hypothetical protein [Lambiella insularis]